MGLRVDFLSSLLVAVVAFSAVLTAQDSGIRQHLLGTRCSLYLYTVTNLPFIWSLSRNPTKKYCWVTHASVQCQQYGIIYFVFALLSARAGLSLLYITETINVVQFAIQQALVVENNMTSIERVMTYTKIDAEPGYDVDTSPPCDWPRNPSIVFTDVSLKYYPGGPDVLKDLNITIEGKMKVGVVGRTGSGKSSIICALLRMPEANGAITIDGIDIGRLNIQESRRHVTVLSQTPVLLSGPLRKSLDPMTQHEDPDLWRALERVQLRGLVEKLAGGLNYDVTDGGGNFSIGERQLLCLARVLLQRNKILVLDEPTAHVDPATEGTLQSTVRDQLKECTVITVAHRLNSIRDCDKILVLDDGEAVAFGSYEELMKKGDGGFSDMMKKE